MFDVQRSILTFDVLLSFRDFGIAMVCCGCLPYDGETEVDFDSSITKVLMDLHIDRWGINTDGEMDSTEKEREKATDAESDFLPRRRR
jgi:hypothetical protein